MQHRDSSSPSTVLFHQKLVGKFNSWEWTCSRHTCAHIPTHRARILHSIRYVIIYVVCHKNTHVHTIGQTPLGNFQGSRIQLSLCLARHPQVWLSGFCCLGWVGRQSYRLHWCSPIWPVSSISDAVQVGSYQVGAIASLHSKMPPKHSRR